MLRSKFFIQCFTVKKCIETIKIKKKEESWLKMHGNYKDKEKEEEYTHYKLLKVNRPN